MRLFITRGTSDGPCALNAMGCSEVGASHMEAPSPVSGDASTASSSSSGPHMRGAVAGVVVIAVMLLALVVGCIIFAVRRRPQPPTHDMESKRRRRQTSNQSSGHELPSVTLTTPTTLASPRLTDEYDIADEYKVDPYRLTNHRYLTPDHLSIILERSGEISDAETVSARSARTVPRI